MEGPPVKKQLMSKPEGYLGIHGLNFVVDFISPTEEKELLRCIDKEVWSTKLSRRTQHYGYVYDYISKTTHEKAPPIPSWCTPIIDRLIEQRILKDIPDQVIVNEYLPGQGIYPHVDSVESFQDGIVSLSLGSAVIMDLINATETKEVWLKPRSVIAFHEEARYKWKHGIGAKKKDNGIARGRRVSLTFRRMRQ